MMPGHPILNIISNGTTYDAAVLEFDFSPQKDTLRFSYVFGSEEYNEWVGANFNDVYGCFVTGPDPQGGTYNNKNIALVPSTNISVKVNSINNGYSAPGVPPSGPCTNCEYYLDNTGGLTIEYDGFTTVLTAWLMVIPCEEYHILLGIADTGDGIYDSGVFIEENSLGGLGPEIINYTILNPPGLTENMVEGHVEADLVFKLPGAEYAPVTICFEISGTAMNGIDYEMMDNCITFEEGEDSAVIHVVPIQDGIIENSETIELIVENTLGCSVTLDTVILTILNYIETMSSISPNTNICSGDETELWVDVNWGFPPYTFNWQPGSYINDTIVVNPEETTTYTVTFSDIFGEAGTDSTTVFVFPGNQNDMIGFSFEMENNPGLPWDAIGDINGDTIMVILPEGPATDSLVASFVVSNCASAYVYGIEQVSGVTANDFINPVIYQVSAQNGDIKEWTVVVEIETGMTDEIVDRLILFPNPSEGTFYLETKFADRNPIELQVMDLTGRIIFQTSISSQDKTEIDLTDQPKGMYFVRVKSAEGLFTEKIVIL
jgi:hypothetical protein